MRLSRLKNTQSLARSHYFLTIFGTYVPADRLTHSAFGGLYSVFGGWGRGVGDVLFHFLLQIRVEIGVDAVRFLLIRVLQFGLQF